MIDLEIGTPNVIHNFKGVFLEKSLFTQNGVYRPTQSHATSGNEANYDRCQWVLNSGCKTCI